MSFKGSEEEGCSEGTCLTCLSDLCFVRGDASRLCSLRDGHTTSGRNRSLGGGERRMEACVGYRADNWSRRTMIHVHDQSLGGLDMLR